MLHFKSQNSYEYKHAINSMIQVFKFTPQFYYYIEENLQLNSVFIFFC